MDGDKKTAPEPEAGWKYQSAAGGDEGVSSDAPAEVEWTASEFVAHEKGVGWYLLLATAALVIAAVIYFVSKEMFSPIVILVMALILGVAGAHKPRTIAYRLDASGLTAGKKFYPYSQFKSFTMPPQNGPFVTVVLIPLKRFGFSTGAFLAPDSQQQALDVLSNHLPLERGEMGLVEVAMQWLRF
jgi:hypothetical protein